MDRAVAEVLLIYLIKRNTVSNVRPIHRFAQYTKGWWPAISGTFFITSNITNKYA